MFSRKSASGEEYGIMRQSGTNELGIAAEIAVYRARLASVAALGLLGLPISDTERADIADELAFKTMKDATEASQLGKYDEQGRLWPFLASYLRRRIIRKRRHITQKSIPIANLQHMDAETIDRSISASTRLIDIDLQIALKYCLDRLNEMEQYIVQLRLDEEPFDQIAESLGRNLSTVQSTYLRSIKKLRRCMEVS